MTEIRTTVDLRHPPERVWRTLTDRELLPKWFGTVEPRPSSISRFELRPTDLPALDELITVELVELDPPHRMELRWPDAGQSTRVVCELVATSEGCRLTVTQTGAVDPWQVTEIGSSALSTEVRDPFRDLDDPDPWQPVDPDRREQAYQQLLDTRLPAVLDWLAFREVDLPQPAVAAGAGPAGPVAEGRSRHRLGIGIALLALAIGTVVVVTGLARGRAESNSADALPPGGSGVPTTAPATPTPGGRPTTAAPATPSRSVRPTPARSAPAGAPNTAQPGRPDLTARYTTVDTRLLGYHGEVVVTNDGDAAAKRWTVVITLPGGAEVSTASGASFQQEDERVTFTGSTLAADRSATIRFEVERDATLTEKRPLSCVVQDRPCAGL